MLKKASKQEIVTSVCILLWIFVVNVATPMITSLPAWPMFFVTIFFFTLGANVKQIPTIFLSGIMGILSAFVLIKLLGVMAPVLGEVSATLILLFSVLAIIIVGGNFLPVLFNNITFCYLTVCTIDMALIEGSTTGWLLMHIVGGMVILAGALLISIMVDKCFKERKVEEVAK